MISAYSDGGSRGNPGMSAYAIVVVEGGEVVHEHAEFLGTHTNNYAEYRGLISAISKVIELGASEAEFVMDSELVIKQMRGEYKVKSPDMRALHDDAKALSSLIPSVRFRSVRRSEEYIPRADALLNAEMDRWSGRRRRPLIAAASPSTGTCLCSPVAMSLRVASPFSRSLAPTMTAYLALAEDANFRAFAIFLSMMSMSAETPASLRDAAMRAASSLTSSDAQRT